jgi:hypothetical protein
VKAGFSSGIARPAELDCICWPGIVPGASIGGCDPPHAASNTAATVVSTLRATVICLMVVLRLTARREANDNA